MNGIRHGTAQYQGYSPDLEITEVERKKAASPADVGGAPAVLAAMEKRPTQR